MQFYLVKFKKRETKTLIKKNNAYADFVCVCVCVCSK